MKRFLLIALSIFLIISMSIGSLAEKAPGETIQFSDISNHWAKEFIVTLTQKEIIGGYPDGTFKPNNNIKVSEFTILVLKTAGIPINQSTGAWYQGAIDTAIEYGIIAKGEFNDYERNINRGEMARMIVRGLGEQASTGETNFADNGQIPSDVKEFVKKAVELGIIGGYPDNSFKSAGNATRAEATVVLTKMMDIRKEGGNIVITPNPLPPVVTDGIPEPDIEVVTYWDTDIEENLWETKHFEIYIRNIDDYSADTQFRIVCTNYEELNSFEQPSWAVEGKWYYHDNTVWIDQPKLAEYKAPIYELSRSPYFIARKYINTFKLKDGMTFEFKVYIKKGKVTKEYPVKIDNFKYIERKKGY
ncbi:S-layer homology domain-containing protein [Geosporobacter ferrireducens]|uniref:S-layer homology domain-containing protein n=1 Tax=Geosporobacter ferrireducens TaxID=1424294 RepID=UPI00139CC781|nr:S-layer homology domain-containing protein [Geosporobacter ferrireducens]MTI53783.1 S-layer homology domain-containing protein [Geosporobacter ferrireducens]